MLGFNNLTTDSPVIGGANASYKVGLPTEADIWPWRYGLYAVGGTCVACVGVVCNCIAIIVLARYKSQTSAPFLLIFLEIFDTMFLLTELFLENLTLSAKAGLIDDSYRRFIKPIYCFTYSVPHITRTCAAYIIVIITLERYIVVAWPLTAHRLYRPKHARFAVLGVFVLAVLFHIPLSLAYSCNRQWNNGTQTEMLIFGRTVFGNSSYFNDIHMTWVNLCVTFIVPFAVLLTFNFLLLLVLWRGRNQAPCADDKQRRTKRERKLSLMIVCMTGVFFLCELFPAVAFIMTSGLNHYVECSLTCNKFTAIADTIAMVNSAINFAIYCATGAKFRAIFRQVFLRCPGQESSDKVSSTLSISKLKARMLGLLQKGGLSP